MDSTTLDRIATALADRYDLDEVIGRGGMATVVRATDVKHHRTVAVKILDPEIGEALGAERFLAEIRVTAGLQHPHLLPLFDSGEAAGRLYYVMPFVEGESLRVRLDRERQLPVDDVLRLTDALAGALDYAHARGVIHRDLKPENILLQARQPLIADFGIALATQSGSASRMTQTGYSVGTPQYMSPEQATGERILTAQSDQFSLAAVVYEMLTGEPPFTGPTAQAILARLLTERPRPVHLTRPSVPPAMTVALERAMSAVPADRFPSTTAFAAALASGRATSTEAGTPTPGPAASTPQPRRRRWGAIAAATGVVMLGGIGTWIVTTNARTAIASPAFNTVLVFPTSAVGNAALAARVDDAIAQELAMLPGRVVRTHTAPVTTDDAAVAAARSAGTAFAIATALVPSPGGAQLRVKLLDVTRGQLVRQAPSVVVAADADESVVSRAVEPVVVATGFATGGTLGPETLPRDSMPRLNTFIAFEEALDAFRRNSVPLAGTPPTNAMRRVVQLEPSFLQARLWLATLLGWNGSIARRPGGVQVADSITQWVAETATRGSRHERLLARVASSQITELTSGDVDALRSEVVTVPRSPIRRLLQGRLLELNRPYEALSMIDASLANSTGSDSTELGVRAGQLASKAEIWHYVGQYDSALAAIRTAKSLRGGTDVGYLSAEFNALAALGRLDELRQRLPEIETAPTDGTILGFAGNVYSTVSNELRAHGHPEEARAVAERGLEWFRFNAQLSRDSATVGLRMALLHQLLGDDAAAEAAARRVTAGINENEVRIAGFLGRLAARHGRTALVDSVTALLQALPADRLQGAPTYELATIEANKGPAHWDQAVRLLELSFRQHVGFGIRRRLHYFEDWQPMRDYPPFRRLITPADAPVR